MTITSTFIPGVCEASLVLVFTQLLLVQNDGAEINNHTSAWNTSIANRWHSFFSWRSNSPPVKQYAAATEILDTKLDGTTREMMLIYGGEGSASDHKTWIYDTQANSWEAIRQQSGPEGIIHHTLVTLCKTQVLLFGGVASSLSSANRTCSNDTWMFEMKHKEWKRVDTVVQSQKQNHYVTPRCRHVASVVHFDNTSCSCKESMIIYSGLSSDSETWRSPTKDRLDDLWLLTCKDEASRTYEWIGLNSSPQKLMYPSITSAFANTFVYVYGAILTSFSGKQRSWEVWSYRVSTREWKQHSNSSQYMLHSGQIIYFSNLNQLEHFLVLCCSKPLVAYDLLRNVWFRPKLENEVPSLVETNFVITKVGNKAIGLGRRYMRISSPNMMWSLTMSDELKLNFLSIFMPKMSPLKPRMLSVGGLMLKQKEILIYGGVTLEERSRVPATVQRLHRLDLTTLQWSDEVLGSSGNTRLRFAYGSTAIVLLDSVLVIYGGLVIGTLWSTKIGRLELEKNVWGYYNQANVRLWIKYSTASGAPPKRFLHAATGIDSQSMVIYGGMSFQILGFDEAKFLHDLWSFTLPSLNENVIDLSKHRTGSRWSMIDQSGPNTSCAMSLVAINNILYMYGGSQTVLYSDSIASPSSDTIEAIFDCLNTLWTFNLSDSCGWKQIEYKTNGPGNRCFHHSHAFGDKMLLTGGCSDACALRVNRFTSLAEIKCHQNVVTSGVWIYDPKTISWLQLTSQPLYHASVIGPFALIYNDLILSFGGLPPGQFVAGQVAGDWNGFSFMKPGCPAGTTSTNLKNQMCYNCSVGHFSDTPCSSCFPCPNGLTTEHEGSISTTNCSRCENDYCGYGTCYVTLLGPSPTCDCQFGFTKNNEGLCTVATYYIAASGFVSGIALFILLVVLLSKHRKARKSHRVMLRNKVRELRELTDTFNLDSKELKLRKRIDQDCPGGFGEVYEAEYREITVAVKKLQGIHLNIDRIELEFEREIEILRTIRHPNIVLFVGGGRYHNDGCPFLVVEYMPRGSLTNILGNESIALEDGLKLRFTIDAAKGMRCLHSLRPPRVHRDLKSSNLLLSQQWVVKVADFGSARLVKDEGISQEAVRGAGCVDLTAPLLHADYQLSSGVGTPRWCAPEILSGEGYGTPADVYSFGIVMWEIWSRQIPYEDCGIRSVLDLNAAVLNGVRPSVPHDEHTDYVELMRACWACDATFRPTFNEIVVKLERMSEVCSLLSRKDSDD